MQIKITFNHFSTIWLAKSQEFHNTLYGKGNGGKALLYVAGGREKLNKPHVGEFGIF